MRGSACYQGEEIEVYFVCDMERSDYGVPGSPTWFEPQNIEILEISILGKVYSEKELPPRLVDDLYELSSEVAFEPEAADE